MELKAITTNVTVNGRLPNFFSVEAWSLIANMGLQPQEWSPLSEDILALLYEFDISFYNNDWFVEFDGNVYNLYTQN